MRLNDYQRKALSTGFYPGRGTGNLSALSYCTLKLNGEAGEIAEKIGKTIRDDDGVITVDKKESLKKELGDVLWYIAALADELNINLEDVAEANLFKLAERQKNNTLKGSGDDR